MTKKHQIMLIEDNQEFRSVLEFSLSGESDMEIGRQCSSAEFALRVLENDSAAKAPTLILLDLNLTGMTGLEALPALKEMAPQTPIIILSQSNRETDVLTAIAKGASGYLLKSSTVDQIIDAIREVIAGGSSLDPKVASYLLKQIRAHAPDDDVNTILTTREREVLEQLAEGYVKKEISDKLGISYRTVDTHIRHIYEKLHVNNGPAAVNVAHKLGLFQ
ncbi:response regulator transcription factor [Coraliomargarita algicola]|uniref:Response regulator transcription factor n=1 Tax=Coraliomargarita algicola TaxID=3092156 RepID=A0ABZ0RMG7_9BACT|nr:response regulator transcription factor [Coraliomargarita sp. J2-16]WPJ96618.1 response regulator transcription factor [Coraliomargarita sp. J2-16]